MNKEDQPQDAAEPLVIKIDAFYSERIAFLRTAPIKEIIGEYEIRRKFGREEIQRSPKQNHLRND